MSAGYLRGWQAVRVIFVRTFLLVMGLTLLMPLVQGRIGGVGVVAVIAPLAFVSAHVPMFFRRKPEPAVKSAEVCEPVVG
jgi:hypothetical protein